jgi:LmbE family N-acetylglucosaminyl deacetylase
MKELLNKKLKIVLSPHYDDLALSIGGLAKHWKDSENIVEDWIIFSFGNYMANDENGNNDLSNLRINKVSEKRYQEELNMASDLKIKTVKKIGCYESIFRDHHDLMAPSQKPYELTTEDKKTFNKIRQSIDPLLDKDIDLFVPLAVGGHYDHILVREVMLSLMRDKKSQPKASIFFYEDLPYMAELNWHQKIEIYFIIKKLNLKKIMVPIDLRAKIDLLKYYPSQLDSSHAPGIITRSRFLQYRYMLKTPGERIFKFIRS